MFGPSFDVQSAVTKVLRKRIRTAQAEMDIAIKEADKKEEEDIKKIKADTLNKKFNIFEDVVNKIIPRN